MTRRLALLASLATATLFAADAKAQLSQSAPLATANQTASGTSFTYQPAGPGTTISVASSGNPALGVLSNFDVNTASFLASPGPLSYNNARFKLNASSTQTATSVPLGPGFAQQLQSGFAGTFSIIASDGITNLLSGTFSGGILSQFQTPFTDSTATIQFTDITFTSDIFLPLTLEGFSLSLAATPELTITGGEFQAFTANSSGTFSAAVVPEPATLAMAGLGMLGLPIAARIIRRRRAK